MRKQIEKIITMTVAAGLMTSTLFGEAGYAAKVKKPYYKTGVKTDYLVNDAALFKKTGVVLSFREKYAETSGYNPVSYSVYGLGADKERPLTGYVMIGNINKFGKSISYEVLDNTDSVEKIVLDGKKSYKLDKVRKPAANDTVLWDDFSKRTASELNMEFKTASKLKIPEGKHILSITDKEVGLGAFTVIGIDVAKKTVSDYNTNTFLLIFVGVITGVGGGVLRDIMSGMIPYIFKKHIYAVASAAGAGAYMVIDNCIGRNTAIVGCSVLVVAVRVLAVHFEWNLPKIKYGE